jgi:uncharacterized RDD family membrane protein YckC
MNSGLPEDQVSIETPEHIVLNYELAGIGSRFLAGFVDTLIQTIVIVLIGVAVSLIGSLEGEVARMPIRVFIVVAAGALIMIGYFVLFEMIWDGQSPGKRMAGLRVIRTDGTPIAIGDSLIRNILRFVDLIPIAYTVGMAAIFFTKRCQRLGDLAAGTIVVKERARELPVAPLPLAEAKLPPIAIPAPEEILSILREGLGRLTPQELATMDRFIERRFELDPAARFRLSQQIAAPLRLHFPALQPTDMPAPEHFLEILWAVWKERARAGLLR